LRGAQRRGNLHGDCFASLAMTARTAATRSSRDSPDPRDAAIAACRVARARAACFLRVETQRKTRRQ
jgi:hypothetical protein